MSHRVQQSDFESVGQHNDNQTAFLKRKLIETHQKLLKQLELTKQLQEQLSLQNETIKKRLEHKAMEDSKGNQRKLKQYENKNNLLRNDLEVMRTRIIAEMLEKTKLEQSLHNKNEIIEKLLSEAKKKQAEMNIKLEDYQQVKARYEETFTDASKYKGLYEQSKRKETFFSNRINDLENFLKVQKEKGMTAINEKKSIEKQMINLKNKVGDNGAIITQINAKMQMEQKEKQRLKLAVQKLNHQLNQMVIKYKVKQRELDEERERPEREFMKQRQNFLQSKELVEKLQNEQRQKQKTSHKKFRTDTSPTRSISPLKYIESPKRDYMDNISEMGRLQNILLQSNVTKNKLLTQIDKIDGIKVKTNQLYMKRKQYQEQLQRIEQIIVETKGRLRILNAI